MTANLVGGAKNVKTIKRTQRRAVLASLKNGATLTNACGKAGISVVTFWRWRMANPRLERLVAALMESQIAIVEDALYKSAVVDGSNTAQIFFLTNRAPEKWRDRRALVNNINAIKIGDGKRVDREFIGEEREQEQRLIKFLREAAD